MDGLLAAIMGLVEGLTEFLPISSTGHLILADHLLRFEEAVGSDFAKTFEVVIQLGAILAVVAAFPGRFSTLLDFRRREGFAGLRGLWLLVLTTIPALIAGAALHGVIKRHLFATETVAIGLMAGAVWILAVEWRRPRARTTELDAIDWREALGIGLFQCIALWPGMSRAAATILGGMMLGVGRKTATQYSFFAAVPVMIAATVFELLKSYRELDFSHGSLIAIGFVVAFFSAWAAVKLLIRFVGNHTLTGFAWYRIALAAVVFAVLLY
jgi:undecaprenyl-diphosphatase